ncbi:MAG: hypothetical protein IT440_01625 [Phycisphaeraceae bacterium]|nr:hypothetical protein [Phycisphaeraceae bacterium]
MPDREIVRDVCRAAMAFHDRKLWRRFTNFDCFALHIPGHRDPLLATVMGDAGEEFGLNLFRGPLAFDTYARLTIGYMPSSDLLESMDTMGFSVDRYCDLDNAAQAFIREAGIRPKRKELVPGFIVKRPNHKVRRPDEGELAIFLVALNAMVWAEDRGLLKATELDDENGICTIRVIDHQDDVEVTVTQEPALRGMDAAKPLVFAASDVNLSGIARTQARWIVGTPHVPIGVKNDDRSMLALLVVEEDSGMLLDAMPFFADETRTALDRLVEAFRSNGLPSNVEFTNQQLHDALQDVLNHAGVKVSMNPANPIIDDILEEFLSNLEQDVPDLERFMAESPVDEIGEEDETEDDGAAPAPDDLQGWKRADRHLIRRFADYLEYGTSPRTERAVKRYFNSADNEHYFEEYKASGLEMAYATWCVVDFRPTKTSQTQAEVFLSRGLPPAQEILLRARVAAYSSLHRVASRDPASGTVVLDDVLVGGSSTIHDQQLSEYIDNGVFLTGRVFPAGNFSFFESIGPSLHARLGMDAVTFLHDCKLPFTPDALRKEAHKLGWLWGWLDEREKNWQPPHLVNTDGEELVQHTAAFSMQDADAVRQALLQHRDVTYDEQSCLYVWSRLTGQDEKILGDTISLGQIELIDQELVLTVNSAERFALGREWISKLPGVGFISVKTRPIDPSSDAESPDDRMPDAEPLEITPELEAALREQLHQRYMQWLDMSLPVLGGQTARQACRTASGREQVTMLIRTMPDPLGNVQIQVPREAMLRELGLPTGPISATSTDVGNL